MKWRNDILVLGGLMLLLASCTHEYEQTAENDWRLDVGLSFVDAEFWPDGQQIRVGVFESENDKEAVSSVIVNQPDGESSSVSISNVPEGNYVLKLYLTESGIFKVFLADLGEISLNENLMIETDPLTLLTYTRIQNQIFNKCQLCHGGSSGDLAAGLNLTSSESYLQLINVQAVTDPSRTRVVPGSSTYSYLVQVLEKQIDFDHDASNSITSADKQLIIDWIDEGALNN